MSRFYADLLKLQFLFTRKAIRAAVYILPSTRLARSLGSNLVNFERMTSELRLFSTIITVPIFIIGLDKEGPN